MEHVENPGAPKILEIGSVPYMWQVFPDTTEFYSSWPEERTNAPEHGRRIVSLAARRAIPLITGLRNFVEAGGLASYGGIAEDAYHQVGVYSGRILKGAKPGDLPVVLASRFELVINLKTAKTLGLTISRDMLRRADDVIE